MNKKYVFWATQVVLSVGILGSVLKFLVMPVNANFQKAVIRYDRLKTSTPTTAFVYFVPQSVGTEAKVRIVFGSGVSVGTGITVNTTGISGSYTPLPGTLAVTATGGSMTITGVTDLTVGTTYAFNIGAGITTPAATGQITDTISTLTAGDTVVDTTTVGAYFVSNDQVVITGNVPPTFTFSIVGSTDTFTTDLIGTTVAVTSGKTVNITTNAAKGWTTWLKSTNAALLSASTGITIPAAGTVNAATSTCAAGSDCYVIDTDVQTQGTGTGTITIDPEYNGTDTVSGGTPSTSFQPIASSNGTTNGDAIKIIARAAITANKQAANDYSDTWTIVGAGSF